MDSTSKGKLVFTVFCLMALICYASALTSMISIPIDDAMTFLCGSLFTIVALNRL